MSKPVATTWPWLSLGMQTVRLGLEMQQVMALRLARIAAGGSLAQHEATLMVTEKIAALAASQALMLNAYGTGRPDRAATRVLALYRRRVKANRRRLGAG
jgi:anti-sigma factor ChrR (cupin superfamily)